MCRFFPSLHFPFFTGKLLISWKLHFKGVQSACTSVPKGLHHLCCWTQDLAAPVSVARLTPMRLHWKSQFTRRGYCSSTITSNNNNRSYWACLVGPAKAFVRNWWLWPHCPIPQHRGKDEDCSWEKSWLGGLKYPVSTKYPTNPLS